MKRTNSSLLRAHSRGSFSRLVFESEHSNGGGDSDRSLLYRFVQLIVIIFRLITPLSYVYLVSFVVYLLKTEDYAIVTNIAVLLFTLWMAAEALFFPYYYMLFAHLNSQKHELEHFGIDKETRTRLVHNCFESMKAAAVPGSEMATRPEIYIRKVLEGWFLGTPIADIKRDNFAAWSGWAFFGKDMNQMTPEDLKDNDELVDYIEGMAALKFPVGHCENLISARLTIDPIFATQRPFMFYATIGTVNLVAHMALFILGFRRRSEYDTGAQSVYYRRAKRAPGTVIGHPIVFIHGIGIGFAHYMAIIASFPRDVDVYLVEWPHVAMQMASSAPKIKESIDVFCRMLDDEKHEKACFVAHSLGTTAVSWMAHDPIASKRVASTVMIDPVTFLLCDPTVATQFVYNPPKTTIDFCMHFFLSRELFIANALSRNFDWSHNILFVEDLTSIHYGVCTETDDDNNGKKKEPSSLKNYSPSSLSDSSKGSANKKSVMGTNDGGGTGKKMVLRSSAKSDQEQDVGLPLDGDEGENGKHQRLNHSIILSSHDAIVPVSSVIRYLDAKAKEGHTCFEVVLFHGSHGELFLYPKWVRLVSRKIRERCGLPVSGAGSSGKTKSS